MNKIIGQPAGYKRIYGGFIPKGWTILPLSAKADIQYGIGDPLDSSITQGVKILSLPNVNKSGDFVLEEIPLIDKAKVKDNDLLKRGDLLFNWRNGSKEHLGKTAFFDLDGDFTHVGFLLRIRTNPEELNPIYLKAYINFLRNKGFFLRAKIQVNNTFNKEELSDLPLMYPDPSEQAFIAEVMQDIDRAIKLNTEIINQKELRKKWLMQQLLTGKKRLKGFSGDWKEFHIRDVAQEVSIRNKFDKQLTVLSCTKYDGLVPSLEYFGRKIFSDDVSTYKVVPKNHFAYATNHIEEGSIGYQEMLDEALISPMYTVFKTDSSINNSYFFRLLKSHKLIYQYQNRMEGSIDRRGGLRWDAFSIIKVNLPSYEEQTAVAEVMNVVDKELRLLRLKTEKLKEKKKGLMQVLLTGKKRINNNNNNRHEQ